jgi:hypothetical protein
MNAKKLKMIEALISSNPEEIPKGWYTMTELCAKLKKGRSTLSTQIRKAIAENPNKIKTKEFRVKTSNAIRSIPHYFFNI